MRFRWLTRIIACVALMGAAGWPLGYAAVAKKLAKHRAPAGGKNAYPIRNSAGVYVSPRGQDYFSRYELSHILFNNNVDLKKRKVGDWTYRAKSTFDLKHLPPKLRPFQETLDTVRAQLTQWLAPWFKLKNPRFNAIAHEIEYESNGIDVQLLPDPILSRSYTDNGIVVDLVLTVPDLKARAQDLCGFDSSNPLFGSCRLVTESWEKCPSETCSRYRDGAALYHPWIRLTDERPIKIFMPILIEIHPGGNLEMLALYPESNLDQLAFETGQDPDILLPKIEFQTGTRTSTLDQAPVRKMLVEQEHKLAQLGIHELQEFVTEGLPERLHEAVFGELNGNFDRVMEMIPPGGTEDDPRLQWGMRPARLGWKDGFAYPGNFAFLSFNGFLRDPELPVSLSPPPPPPAEPPRLSALAPQYYDFAIPVRLGMINQLLEMGFRRGTLGRVAVGTNKETHKKIYGQFAEAPYVVPGGDGRGRIHLVLALQRSDDWGEMFALKNPYRVALDIEFFMQPSGPRSYDFVAHHIDLGTAHVLSQDVDHLSKTVADVVLARIREANSGFPIKPTRIQGPDLSVDFFRTSYHNVQAAFEDGYLVFYMAFGGSGP